MDKKYISPDVELYEAHNGSAGACLYTPTPWVGDLSLVFMFVFLSLLRLTQRQRHQSCLSGP